MTKISALQRIKEIDIERAKLHEAAKAQLLEEISKLLSELSQIGENYVLAKAGEVKKPKVITRKMKGGPCSICQFETSPPHDGRQHRHQGSNPRKFTDKELKEREWVKVESKSEQPPKNI